MTIGNSSERGQGKIEALQAENLHLRQLVGELLLKNQQLREADLQERIVVEQPHGAPDLKRIDVHFLVECKL